MAKRQTKMQDISEFKSAWIALEGRREIVEFDVDAGNFLQSPRLEDELCQAIEKIREAQAAVAKLKPEWRSRKEFKKAKSDFAKAASDQEEFNELDINSFATVHVAASDGDISYAPGTAPELWSDRKPGRKESPIDFILRVYGEDSEQGRVVRITRPELRSLDKALYQAYATFLSRNGGKDPLGLPTRSSRVTDALAHMNPVALHPAAKLYAAQRMRAIRKSR